jgi:hypothetical protein
MNVVVRKQLAFETDRVEFTFRFEPVGTHYVSRPGWLPYTTDAEWLEYVEKHRRPDDTRVVE